MLFKNSSGIFTLISCLPIIFSFNIFYRYVQYANDELDYGMGLELGLDLLAFGGEVFHSTILHLLGVAYELLERPEFYTILKVFNLFAIDHFIAHQCFYFFRFT